MMTEQEIGQAKSEQGILQQRLQLAHQTRQRFEVLASSGFVSPIQLQQKDEERLDVERNLSAVSRSLTALLRDKDVLLAK